jgi:hypothetical protein
MIAMAVNDLDGMHYHQLGFKSSRGEGSIVQMSDSLCSLEYQIFPSSQCLTSYVVQLPNAVTACSLLRTIHATLQSLILIHLYDLRS